ncbi:MAG: cation transporter [Methylococcales bacterium]|nr:cation transporter [Methylococcales bacterium]
MAIKSSRLSIDGMQCLGCEEMISQAVSVLPGVHGVKVSYKNALADVIRID